MVLLFCALEAASSAWNRDGCDDARTHPDHSGIGTPEQGLPHSLPSSPGPLLMQARQVFLVCGCQERHYAIQTESRHFTPTDLGVALIKVRLPFCATNLKLLVTVYPLVNFSLPTDLFSDYLRAGKMTDLAENDEVDGSFYLDVYPLRATKS